MLRWALLACAGLELAYVVGVNAFLTFGGTALLFQTTNTVNATFRRAWSLWPGSVHLRDLRLVFQDPNVQFSIDLPRVHVNIALAELARRSFHATSVTGEGLVFRMRHRIHPEVATEPLARELPRIPEYLDPPVFEPMAPLPPIPDESYDLWTVHLEGVDIGLQEIWAQFARYTGRGRASGAFRLRPARELSVGPAALELEPGRLTLGASRELVRELSGKIRCAVHEFDVRKPVGMEVFRYVSGTLALRGDGVSADGFEPFLPHPDRVALGGVPGSLRLDAELDHGVISERSVLDLAFPELRVSSGDLAVTARSAKVEARGQPGGGGSARLDVEHAEVARAGALGVPLRAGGVFATVTSSSRDVVAAWALVDARAGAAHARLDDARWAEDLALPTLRIQGGAISASVDARWVAGEIDARASVSLEQVRALAGGVAARLDGRVTAEAQKIRWPERTGEVVARYADGRVLASAGSTRVRVNGVAVEARARAGEARTEGSVVVSMAEARLDSPGDAGAALSALRGSFSTRFVQDERGSNAVFSARVPELRARRDSVGITAAFELGAELFRAPGARPASRLATRASLRKVVLVSHGGDSDDQVFARAEHFDLRSQLRRDAAGRLHGRVDSEARALLARVGGTWIRGDSRLGVTLRDFDSARTAGHVKAELEMQNLVADDRGDGSDCPWSTVPRGTVSADLELDPVNGAHGSVEVDVERARLIWGDFRASGDALLKARVEGVSFAEQRGSAQFRASARAVKLRSGADLTSGWEAQVPTLIVSGRVDAKDKVSGTLRLSAERSQGRIGRATLETDVGADFRILSLDVRGQQSNVTGSVRLDRARVRAGDEKVDDWWARVEVGSALFSARENLDISALFRAKLRDALPGIAVLSASGDLPGWFGAALPLRELSVTGAVNRRCRLTDIRFTSVAGGPLVSRGRMQSVPEAVRGAFLVRMADLEAISAGVSFEADQSNVQLFASDDWLRDHEGDLNALAERSVAGVCVAAPRQCGD